MAGGAGRSKILMAPSLRKAARPGGGGEAALPTAPGAGGGAEDELAAGRVKDLNVLSLDVVCAKGRRGVDGPVGHERFTGDAGAVRGEDEQRPYRRAEGGILP